MYTICSIRRDKHFCSKSGKLKKLSSHLKSTFLRWDSRREFWTKVLTFSDRSSKLWRSLKNYTYAQTRRDTFVQQVIRKIKKLISNVQSVSLSRVRLSRLRDNLHIWKFQNFRSAHFYGGVKKNYKSAQLGELSI